MIAISPIKYNDSCHITQNHETKIKEQEAHPSS